MSEKKETVHEPNLHQQLKEQLLSGKISPDDFVSAIENLDQKIPTRDHAEENAKLFDDPQVKEILEKDSEVQLHYRLTSSLTFFHVGQRALANGDIERAKKNLKRALGEASELTEEDTESWRLYIEATNAYVEKDLDQLKMIEPQIKSGNRVIVQNMIQGLEKTGEIDYRRDYRNTPNEAEE